MPYRPTRAYDREDQQDGPVRYPDVQSHSRDDVSLKDLVEVVRRRRAIIVVTVLLLTTLSWLVASSLTPRYAAVSALIIEPRGSHVIDTKAVVEEEEVDGLTLAAEIKLLGSQTYAQDVIRELDLLLDPEFNPALQKDGGFLATLAARLPVLLSWMPESWITTGLAEQPWPSSSSFSSGAASHQNPLGDAAGSPKEIEVAEEPQPPALSPPGTDAHESSMDGAVRVLLEGLEIDAVGDSLILIEFTSTNPHNAARVADKVAELYVEDQLQMKQEATTRAIDWLQERVAELQEQVLQAEKSVEAYRAEYGLIGGGTQQLTELNEELIVTRAKRIAEEAKLRSVRELRDGGGDLGAPAEVLSSPLLIALRQQEIQLLREEAQLQREYGERHPKLVQLAADKQIIAERVAEEMRSIIRNLENEVAFARNREQALEERLEQVKAQSAAVNQTEIRLRELERQATAERSLYTAFLSRLKEVSEQRDLLEPGARVASRAGVPAEPSFPKPKLMTAAGFTASLIIGTLLAFTAEYFDNGLRTSRQVERVLGLPNLGFVPRVGGLKRGQKLHQYLREKPRSAYAEAIRAVQIATMRPLSGTDRPPRVVLVTSSLPGEGKTTLALSLAASAAYSGHKVILVDLDLRHPRLRREIDQALTAGLVEFIAGEKALDEVIYTVNDDGHASFDVIPVKRSTSSPADLLRSSKMAALVAELRARYEYIVLDSPPLLGIIDAKVAASLADAVLFVVQWEKTREDVALTALDVLIDGQAPLAGAVLTQINMRRHAKRGYGDAVQYYGKYDRYYLN